MRRPLEAGGIEVVLAWARRALDASGAAYVPLVPGPESEHDAQGDDNPALLLGPEDRAALRSGAALRDRGRLALPVRSHAGAVFGAVAVALRHGGDPTERDERDLGELCLLLGQGLDAEAARSEEGEFARFFALSLDNLCIAGFDGYFKLLNPRWETTLGYSLEELYSRPFVEFVHPEDQGRTAAETASLGRGTGTITFSNRYMKRNGETCYLQWTASPSYERERIYAVARDVTAQVQAEEDLKKSRAEAQAASQAKSAFLAMMSHELRTPLNSIIGFSDLLLRNEEKNLDAEELKYAERILANGIELLTLINSILDLSRIEAGRVQPEPCEVDLTELARGVVDTLRPLRRQGVALALDAPGRAVPFRTDPARLRQILLNLVGNGLKFTERGEVVLALRVDERGAPIAFEVRDTGPGIRPEDLSAVFEPFRQLEDGERRRYGGSGLGLPISRSFADALGLALEVESEPGRGTTFRVVLAGSASDGR